MIRVDKHDRLSLELIEGIECWSTRPAGVLHAIAVCVDEHVRRDTRSDFGAVVAVVLEYVSNCPARHPNRVEASRLRDQEYALVDYGGGE